MISAGWRKSFKDILALYHEGRYYRVARRLAFRPVPARGHLSYSIPIIVILEPNRYRNKKPSSYPSRVNRISGLFACMKSANCCRVMTKKGTEKLEIQWWSFQYCSHLPGVGDPGIAHENVLSIPDIFLPSPLLQLSVLSVEVKKVKRGLP